jgi:hypothetical protein
VINKSYPEGIPFGTAKQAVGILNPNSTNAGPLCVMLGSSVNLKLSQETNRQKLTTIKNKI